MKSGAQIQQLEPASGVRGKRWPGWTIWFSELLGDHRADWNFLCISKTPFGMCSPCIFQECQWTLVCVPLECERMRWIYLNPNQIFKKISVPTCQENETFERTVNYIMGVFFFFFLVFGGVFIKWCFSLSLCQGLEVGVTLPPHGCFLMYPPCSPEEITLCFPEYLLSLPQT